MQTATQFYARLFSALSSALFGLLLNMAGNASFAKLLNIFAVIGYVGSGYCFWKAGTKYKLMVAG